MTLRKILCPIDFSPSSDAALQTAVRLAAANDSELVLAHVWYIAPVSVSSEYFYPAEMISGLVADADRGMASAVEKARALGAKRVSGTIVEGQPWVKIVELADNDPAIDLIAIGSRGRSGLARIFLGSVAEMVVRHAPCSVLAVPSDHGATPFARVLCPIDFSESSRQAFELALTLAPPTNRSVTLLHIVEPPRIYGEEPVAMEVDPGLGTRARQQLEQLGTEVTAKQPAKVTPLVRIGRAGTQILAVLGEEYDLIALGSHGRTGLRRMLLGSVAERVVRHAARPVLVARARRT